jgi:ribonuclease HI
MDVITVYADGGCRGNGKPKNIGGWGTLIKFPNVDTEGWGHEINTTNNRMELISCIKALEIVTERDIPIKVVMDSEYVVKGVNGRVKSWLQRKNNEFKNKDLWLELLYRVREYKNITFTHCYGHADTEGNIRADKLANRAMDELKRKGII